jgi:hypothetical protein
VDDFQLAYGKAVIRFGNWAGRQHVAVCFVLLMISVVVLSPVAFVPPLGRWHDRALDRAEAKIGDALDATA